MEENFNRPGANDVTKWRNRPFKPVQRYTATIGEQTFVRNSPNTFIQLVVGRQGMSRPLEPLKWCQYPDQALREVEFRSAHGYCDLQILEVRASEYKREIR